MYSPVFVEKQPELARAFMVAYVKGMRDYNDAFEKNKNKEEAIAILMKHTNVKDRETYEKVANVGLHPDAILNVESMKHDAQWLFKNGYIKQMPDLNKVANLTYVEHAIRQLGEYK
jgi:NitT/TauT family transport system substrate-binding protein